MSRDRRIRRERLKQLRKQPEPAPAVAEPPVHSAVWLLLAAFLLPNLGALVCGFVLDDLPLIVENEKLHSLRNLRQIWTSGYWPDRGGLFAYRPVAQTLWVALWSVGHGRPLAFHVLGVALGLAVVLLLHRFLLAVKTPPRTAFIAALLFALFPIHVEATTSVVGSAELLAAAFGLGALLLYYRGWRIPALVVFALAVFSKESAAAVAAVPALFPRAVAGGATGLSRHRNSGMNQQWRHKAAATFRLHWRDLAVGAAAVLIVGAALLAHRAIATGVSFIPPIDNAMGLLGAGPGS